MALYAEPNLGPLGPFKASQPVYRLRKVFGGAASQRMDFTRKKVGIQPVQPGQSRIFRGIWSSTRSLSGELKWWNIVTS